MNAITRREYDPRKSALKRARLTARRAVYRCAYRDYWGFTYWSLKIEVLQRREDRLMERLIATLRERHA